MPLEDLMSLNCHVNDVGEIITFARTDQRIEGLIPNLEWLIPFQWAPLVFPVVIEEKKKGGWK
jgi:hypothetical protein